MENGNGSMDGKNGSSLVDFNRVRETNVVDVRPKIQMFEELPKMMITDDLSAMMWSDFYFVQAVENWRFVPSHLYGLTFEIGFERTRAEIQDVRLKRNIGNKGGYLRRRLENIFNQIMADRCEKHVVESA